MGVSEVKGLARYVKVLDVSEQDNDPNLSFADKEGTRIVNTSGAVPAGNYAAAAQAKIEAEKKAIADKNAQLEAERDAAIVELAALKAEKAKALAEELAKTQKANSEDKKKDTK
jgi:hypothetical protein